MISIPIRLLFLAANPDETGRLRLDEEFRSIKQRVREGSLRDRFDIESEWAVQEEALSLHLLQYRPSVVHFSGHGETDGEIILASDHHGMEAVAPQRLASLFRILRNSVRVELIVINACWSEAQATALVSDGGVPWVVGMKRPISDPAAIAFAAGFYRALGFGESVQTAFDLGVHNMSKEYESEADIPQLLKGSEPKPARTAQWLSREQEKELRIDLASLLHSVEQRRYYWELAFNNEVLFSHDGITDTHVYTQRLINHLRHLQPSEDGTPRITVYIRSIIDDLEARQTLLALRRRLRKAMEILQSS